MAETHGSKTGGERAIAVVLTMRRPQELDRLLTALETQQRRPDAILVIENTPHADNAAVLARHPSARHVISQRNLGGAGGFAFGIFCALADGATHVWLMDDDGRPENQQCLGSLLRASRDHNADLVSPLIIDIEDPTRLAFPFVLGRSRYWSRASVADRTLIEGFAHLFNGALVKTETFERYGVPDLRLFLRGDEVDFMHRVVRGGGRVVTVVDSGFLHPSGGPETHALLGNRLHAVMPNDPVKQFYFFRNRGYLLRRHRLVLQALSDSVRYPYFFLVKRRGDWSGLARWVGLTLRGARGDFRRFGAR